MGLLTQVGTPGMVLAGKERVFSATGRPGIPRGTELYCDAIYATIRGVGFEIRLHPAPVGGEIEPAESNEVTEELP